MQHRNPVIFFDIDDTLIDQRRAEAAAAARFLERFGAGLECGGSVEAFCTRWRALREKYAPGFLQGRISVQQQRRLRMRELFAGAEPGLGDEEADRRFAWYLEHYRRAWELFDDVLPALELLSGWTLGVISNGHAHQQRLKLRRTGIAGRFRHVLISEDVGEAKPGARIFLEACARAGCEPGDGVYVGDRLDLDAGASRAAGLRGVWLNRRGEHGEAAGAVIRSLLELPRIVEHHRRGEALAGRS